MPHLRLVPSAAYDTRCVGGGGGAGGGDGGKGGLGRLMHRYCVVKNTVVLLLHAPMLHVHLVLAQNWVANVDNLHVSLLLHHVCKSFAPDKHSPMDSLNSHKLDIVMTAGDAQLMLLGMSLRTHFQSVHPGGGLGGGRGLGGGGRGGLGDGGGGLGLGGGGGPGRGGAGGLGLGGGGRGGIGEGGGGIGSGGGGAHNIDNGVDVGSVFQPIADVPLTTRPFPIVINPTGALPQLVVLITPTSEHTGSMFHRYAVGELPNLAASS